VSSFDRNFRSDLTVKGLDKVYQVQWSGCVDWRGVGQSKTALTVPASATTLSSSFQCWTTNVKSNLTLFRAAAPTFNANPEGGVFIATSSIAVWLAQLWWFESFR
jgi:hypothetical protein